MDATQRPPRVHSAVHAALLDRTREIAERVLAPRAAATDQADTPPFENIRILAGAGVLGIGVPERYGGSGGGGKLLRDVTETIAASCGVTMFTLFQHHGCCKHVCAGENEELKARLLPRLATGEVFATLAFSHLRRPGPPCVRVEKRGSDYVFNGTAPWATGWGLAREVLLAGTREDGTSVWVVAPLEETDALRASPPMRLCAANASATVSLTLRDFRVGEERFVQTMTPAQLAADTAAAILYFSALSLGAAVGAVRLIRGLAGRGGSMLESTASALEAEIDAARAAVDACASRSREPGFPAEALNVRASCIELGVRAAHAAVAASGGAANGTDHAAQRLMREAMLYTLTAQTADLRAATLSRLSRPRQG